MHVPSSTNYPAGPLLQLSPLPHVTHPARHLTASPHARLPPASTALPLDLARAASRQVVPLLAMSLLSLFSAPSGCPSPLHLFFLQEPIAPSPWSRGHRHRTSLTSPKYSSPLGPTSHTSPGSTHSPTSPASASQGELRIVPAPCIKMLLKIESTPALTCPPGPPQPPKAQARFGLPNLLHRPAHEA